MVLTVAHTLLILCSQPGEVQSLAPVIETFILLGLLENFVRPWTYLETSLFSSPQTSRKWDRINDILKLKLAKLILWGFLWHLRSWVHILLGSSILTTWTCYKLPYDTAPWFWTVLQTYMENHYKVFMLCIQSYCSRFKFSFLYILPRSSIWPKAWRFPL